MHVRAGIAASWGPRYFHRMADLRINPATLFRLICATVTRPLLQQPSETPGSSLDAFLVYSGKMPRRDMCGGLKLAVEDPALWHAVLFCQ